MFIHLVLAIFFMSWFCWFLLRCWFSSPPVPLTSFLNPHPAEQLHWVLPPLNLFSHTPTTFISQLLSLNDVSVLPVTQVCDIILCLISLHVCFFFSLPWSLFYSSPSYRSLFFFNLLVSFFQNRSLQSIIYTNAWLIYLKNSFIDSGMNSWNNNLLPIRCVIFLFSSLTLHPFLCIANRIKVTLPILACKRLTIQPRPVFLASSLTIPRSQSLLYELVSGSA